MIFRWKSASFWNRTSVLKSNAVKKRPKGCCFEDQEEEEEERVQFIDKMRGVCTATACAMP